jgi:phosphatidylglycerophosphatase A
MIWKWLATFGGVGLLRGAPGTYASLISAVIFYLIWRGAPPLAGVIVLALILLATVAAVLSYPRAAEQFGAVDPRAYVLDEVIGQWVTFLFIPSLCLLPGAHDVVQPPALAAASYVAVAFFLFRAFDVAKVYPIRAVESLPGYWGVILDDILAGIFAGVALRLLILLTTLVLGPEMVPR